MGPHSERLLNCLVNLCNDKEDEPTSDRHQPTPPVRSPVVEHAVLEHGGVESEEDGADSEYDREMHPLGLKEAAAVEGPA